ncbi:MAG: N-acetyltransferase family protein [Chromatiales bacterium]|nr:N-acetyltransferase family protein [Chromatiales bacterium]
MIRQANRDDSDYIAAIYNHYIQKTVITFEEEAVSTGEMAERIKKVASSGLPWLVAEVDGEVIGYAYASEWSGRCAYRYSVEVTVYLSNASVSKGWGTKLYAALFAQLRDRSIHTVIGAIALPNPASIALHEKLGMKKVAHFEEVGFKFDKWIDVGYWQGRLNT